MLAALLTTACVLYGVGLKKDLPYGREHDELGYVDRSVTMAMTGDLDPHWFQHPASTITYPLALAYRLWRTPAELKELDVQLRGPIDGDAPTLYLIGRMLSSLYALLSIPFVYLIGRRVFDVRTGLLAAAWTVACPLLIDHAQWLRTDMAATFWGLLALWASLRVHDDFTCRNRIIAGLALGLACGTRYLMVVLAPVLLASLALGRRRALRDGTLAPGLSLVAPFVFAVLGFAVSTPYFFVDWTTVIADIRHQARSTEPGADGLTPAGNLLWYLTQVIPGTITWPAWLLAAGGIVEACVRDDERRRILALFAIVFVIGISLPALHWQRWVIQVIPVLALFAADAALRLLRCVPAPTTRNWITAATLLVLSFVPVRDSLLMAVRHARDSTRLVTRHWIERHVAAGTRIVMERRSVPLVGLDVIVEEPAVAAEHSVEHYAADGYRYIVVSSERYRVFEMEPERYGEELSFYRDLAARARLVHESTPSRTRGGPVIRVYDLAKKPPADTGARDQRPRTPPSGFSNK